MAKVGVKSVGHMLVQSYMYLIKFSPLVSNDGKRIRIVDRKVDVFPLTKRNKRQTKRGEKKEASFFTKSTS
jgi:hypothetical protein